LISGYIKKEIWLMKAFWIFFSFVVLIEIFLFKRKNIAGG